MDLVHNSDVVQLLLGAAVCMPDSWLWHKQLRFYISGTPTEKDLLAQDLTQPQQQAAGASGSGVTIAMADVCAEAVAASCEMGTRVVGRPICKLTFVSMRLPRPPSRTDQLREAERA